MPPLAPSHVPAHLPEDLAHTYLASPAGIPTHTRLALFSRDPLYEPLSTDKQETMFFLLTSVLACQLMATSSTLSGSAGRVSVSSSSPEPILLPSLSLSEPSVTNTSPWRTMSTWRSESKDEEGGEARESVHGRIEEEEEVGGEREEEEGGRRSGEKE